MAVYPTSILGRISQWQVGIAQVELGLGQAVDGCTRYYLLPGIDVVPLLASTKLHDLCPCFCRSQDLMLYGRSLSLYKRANASAARSYLLLQYLIGTGITNTFVLPNNVLNRINSSSIIGIDSFCKTVDRPCFLSRSQFGQIVVVTFRGSERQFDLVVDA